MGNSLSIYEWPARREAIAHSQILCGSTCRYGSFIGVARKQLAVQQGRCNPSHNGFSRKHNYSSNTDGALPTSWSIGGCLGQPSPPNAGKPERGEGAMPHFIKLLFKYSEIPSTLDTSFVSPLHHTSHHVACHSIACHRGTACGNGQ